MNIIVYGKVKNRNEFADVCPEDNIVGKWDLNDTKLDTDMLYRKATTCVLLIDGEYKEMLSACLASNIPIIRILSIERYVIYKDIERKLIESEGDSWKYIQCIYYEYQRIIKMYEHDNQVIEACKRDFIKKIEMMNDDLFKTVGSF